MFFDEIKSKVRDRAGVKQTAADWKAAGDKIVFTNGCFDLLHLGHVHYLAQARDLGDRLIIGVNTDASVRRLKGTHRPIQDEYTRCHLLAALAFVDAVVLFEEETPLNLIKIILPDFLVKGGDWKPDQIVGAAEVLANGGEVHSLSFLEGFSTTNIEKKIIAGADFKD